MGRLRINRRSSTHSVKRMTRQRSAGLKGWRETRAFLPVGVVLLLVAGCSILPGGPGEKANTDSDGSSSTGQTSEDKANMLVVDAVKSSSPEISKVRVIPAVDGLASYVKLYVTMSGQDVTAAQIEAILTAATGVVPDGNSRIEFCVWESDGLDGLSLVEQAQELGVPEEYVLEELTLQLPLEWLQAEYGVAP